MNKWSIYIWLMLLIASCVTEDIVPPITGDPDAAVTIRLAFQKDADETRALTATEEMQIDSMILFVFKQNPAFPNDRSKDLYMYDLKVSKAGIISGAGNEKSVTVKFKSDADPQRFIIIANPPSGIVYPSAPATTVEDILNLSKFSSLPWRNELNSSNFVAFPMFGQVTDFHKVGMGAPPSEWYPGPPTGVVVNLIRALAKVEVGVDVNNNTGDPALGFGSYFKIHQIYVCNVSSNGYIAPKLAGTDSMNLVTGDTSVDSVKYIFPAVQAHVVPWLSNTIYIPERDSSSDASKKPTFLIAKATYYGDTAFYRIDLAKNNKYLRVLRNKTYKISITGLRKTGYKTLADAFNAAPIKNLNPNLALGDDPVETTIKEVVYNKYYYLGVSTTKANIDYSGGSITVNVKTDVPGGWTFTTGPLPTGVSSGTATTNTLSFNVPNNYTGAPVRWEALIKAGDLSQTVTFTQSPGSYSYILPNNGSIIIPLRSANIDGVPRVNGSLPTSGFTQTGNSVSAIDLMIGTLPEAIKVTARTGVYGPSIIHYRNGDGKVIWSWLVWHLNVATVDAVPYDSYNGYDFMRPYLGGDASGSNVLFQWGRKDALFSDATTTKVQGAVITDTAIVHPHTLYYTTNAPFDWNSTQNNNLWVGVNGEKGAYDPCPFGWRVPPAENDGYYSPWYDFTNGFNSITFSSGGHFDGVTGNYVTTGGGVWSASSRGTGAYGFVAGAVNKKLNRADAYHVRCVRDNIRRIQ